jgi:hypothetical protein
VIRAVESWDDSKSSALAALLTGELNSTEVYSTVQHLDVDGALKGIFKYGVVFYGVSIFLYGGRDFLK